MSENQTGALSIDISIDGKAVPDGHLQQISIERDMFQPDMASITLANQEDLYSPTKVGSTIEVKAGKESETVYKGLVVGIEPIYRGGEKSRLVIRSFNEMHKLLRKRASRTFTDKTDQQIINQVAQASGLSLEWKHETTLTYKHVYQHNQTDLEFIRVRAARLGCHVWCEDKKLFVKQPELDKDSGLELSVDGGAGDGDGALQSFSPRMSSTQIVSKVTVKGWNPETKELITGEATVQSSRLGGQTSVAGSGDLASEDAATVDHPIWSKEEATALAKARLQELSLSYMTGEAVVQGFNTKAKLGASVKFQANARGDSDPFNGRYYVMGVTFRSSPSMNQSAGKKDVAQTILRLARDAATK